jgi:flagellar biosynthesis protein FliQ
MIVDDFGYQLITAFQNVGAGVVEFLPRLVVAVVIFILGWVVAYVLGRFVSQVVTALRVDRALKELHVEEVVTRAGFRLHSGHFLGKIVEWFIVIVFLVASLEVLGLSQTTMFLREVVLTYLPNVIIAAIILIFAALISNAVYKIVVGSAMAARVPSAHFLGGVSKWAIWIFALIAALQHLGIATELLGTLFTGLVYMLAIAGGLAFGLGGKEAAAHFINRLRGEISGK